MQLVLVMRAKQLWKRSSDSVKTLTPFPMMRSFPHRVEPFFDSAKISNMNDEKHLFVACYVGFGREQADRLKEQLVHGHYRTAVDVWQISAQHKVNRGVPDAFDLYHATPARHPLD